MSPPRLYSVLYNEGRRYVSSGLQIKKKKKTQLKEKQSFEVYTLTLLVYTVQYVLLR